MASYPGYFDNTQILITGGAGSIGTALVMELLANSQCNNITVFSRGETAQWQLQQTLATTPASWESKDRVRFAIGDIKHASAIRKTLISNHTTLVIHTAAMKHVPVCESSPYEAAQTNIVGMINIVDACADIGVRQLQVVSTDKAAEAISVMGMTKYLAEKIALDSVIETVKVVRFGNVIGSNGSVVHVFKQQLESGKVLTLTDPDMTRFVMSPSEAAKFTLWSAAEAPNRTISVKQMRACTVRTLAQAVAKNKDVQYTVIGKRPGEKNDEVLFSDLELARLTAQQTALLGLIGVITPSVLPSTESASEIALKFENPKIIGYDEVVKLLADIGI